jgi:glycosyltransferase involved in cell wall biosynthesis
MISVIIPANDEERWIGRCLGALFAASAPGAGAEAVVVANGCRDATVATAEATRPAAAQAGWVLTVLDLPATGKPGALNAGDVAARHPMRAYLDADVRVSAPLMARLVAALDRPGAAYASGRPVVDPPASRVTRAYARFWSGLPFARSPAPGFGLFAVNAAGRARWPGFPPLISDDTYVRLLFAPEERIEVAATYAWPMVEGFGPLVRVRRRQDAGVAEIARLHPGLLANEAKPRLGAAGLALRALRDPAGFAVYAAVSAAVRAGRRPDGWTRGR